MSDVNLSPKERIKKSPKFKFLPFKHINALTDLSTNTVYLSTNINLSDINDIMMDEMAHIFSGSAHHKKRWTTACKSIYGRIPKHNPEVDALTDKYYDILNKGTTNLCHNVGNITGIQNLLTDYHLLQSYRKFSQKVLGTDGSWEITGDNKIRLKPTPKGSFPVVIRYLPSVNDFQIPSHKEVATRALIAEAKIILGHTRRKISLPSSDGGTIQLDGSELVTEGREEKKEIIELALSLGEPLGFMIK